MEDIKIGSRVIYKPIKYGTNEADTESNRYGRKATVIAIYSRGCSIAFDDYPECRNREILNRFLAERKELEILED